MSNIDTTPDFVSLSRETMAFNAQRERQRLIYMLEELRGEFGIECTQPIVFENGMFEFEVRDRFGNVIGSVESSGEVDSYDYEVVYFVFSSGDTRETFEKMNKRQKFFTAEDAAANYAFEAIKAELF